jgi:outer membrane protein assembly factor BamB
MWTKPTGFGGVVGGNYTTAEGLTFYDGTAYETFFNFPSGVIIMSGRLYYPLPLGSSTTGGGYVCVDLTTGETLWHKDYAVNPTFGQLYDYESMNQHGVVRNGYLWAVSGGFSYVTFQMEPITWIAYDPWTGDWLFNETNVPSGTSVYGPNGEILIYQLDMAGKWLALWNNTAAHGLTGATDPSDTTSPDFNTWRPVGKIVDMSQAYSWNVTISADLSGQGPPTIIKVIPGDLVLGTSTPDITAMLQEGTPNPYSLWAISDRPGTRGQLLWKKSYPAPSNGITRSTGPMWRGLLLDPATRVFTMYDKETIQWWGYSLDDGSVVWGPTAPEHPLNFYSDFGIPRYDVAYGKLYSVGLSGILYCYDHRTGTLLWNYTSEPSGSASVWPNWPLGIGAIADGKVYLFTTEHSANAPHWRGVQMQCVNATTGERVWTIDTYGCQASMAVADGYFTYYNMYDMQMYCVGKGPSQMTVTSSPKVSTFGSSVLIEGKVTDIAAGTTQPEQAARFPNGVPAVSDESMSSWMEYIYMQKPRPTDVTGVKVSIDIFDSNNNYRNIGTAATDANGAFSLMWKPDIPGKYTVIATFEGTNSYYGSHEETSFGVDEAVSTATPEPTKAPATAADLYLLPGIGAIIAAIAIVGAIIVLMLRKK